MLTAAREEVDLARQDEVDRFVRHARPDAIVLAAAKVGGILAKDTYPANFLCENLLIAASVFRAAHPNDVDQLLLLPSTCIEPRLAPQPIEEE